MDEVKLLPCPNPWCEDGIYLVETREGGFFRVGCSCGVAGPPSTDEANAIKFWNTRPPIVTDEVVERVAREQFDWQHGTALTWESRPAHERNARIKQARHWCDLPTISSAIAAMPAIPQSLGAIPGSHPADQAPSGLGASRFDPERVERVARAIAAGKRDPRTQPEEIDRVWTAYCGQARAALAADDSALANENADLIHDLERQMTIANIECNVAESARDALRQCARLARMESSSLATAIVETVNNALASVGRSGNRQDRADGLGPKDEHAVGEAETPTPGSMPTIDQDGGEG